MNIIYESIGNLRRSDNEASERYPDSYIAMRKDSRTSQMGTVLFVGDNQSELMKLILNLDDSTFCGINIGLNLQCTLGGVVTGV